MIKDPYGIELPSSPYLYKDLAPDGVASFTWKCDVEESDAGLNYQAVMLDNSEPPNELQATNFHIAKPMNVEYDHMEGLDVWNGHLDDSSRKEVLDIFKEVVLDLNMDPDEQNLPDYVDQDGIPGPFPDDFEEILLYVNAHYNTTLGYSWHLLAVDNYELNGPTYQGNPGITITPPASNQVRNIASERFSFIFVQDIDNYAANEGWSIEKTDSLKWEVIAHELGHQRAGLTHPLDSEGSQYHNQLMDLDENYGEDAVCIMQSNAWGWLPGGEIRFCTQDYPYQDAYYQHNSTCLGNIITNLNAN